MNDSPASRRRPAGFLRREDGASTGFGLFMFTFMVMFGGLAVDLASFMAARTQLQIAADTAAHAALVTREREPETAAKDAALEVLARNMPARLYGEPITRDDIVFGRWDPEARSFVPLAGSRDAVQVLARRDGSRLNALRTYLLGFIGRNQLDLSATTVVTTFLPGCLREGFVANGVVDIQSNNTFVNGFCIHSNTHVKLSNNNFFEPGVTVSMPDRNNIVLPSGGFASNPGLEDALHDARLDLRILERLDEIVAGMSNPASPYHPDYLKNTGTVTINRNSIRPQDVHEGRIHTASCGGGGQLKIDGTTVFRNAVLITNCRLMFENGAAVENAVIISTNTDSRSMTAPNGLRLGVDDGCAPGGGAQLVSFGGMDFASGLEVFGSQLIAAGDIEFAASSNGIQGASFVAGGSISGTSNMVMGFCGAGMEDNLKADYFRMAM